MKASTLVFALIIFLIELGVSQCIENPVGSGAYLAMTGDDCNAVNPTAAAFLRTTPDARGASMGSVGVATDPDASSVHYNSAKLAFAANPLALVVSFSDRLWSPINQQSHLAYLAGYKRMDELQTIGFSAKYFSVGDVQFLNEVGQPAGFGRPKELELALGFARKLGERFSVGLTGKIIYSDLAAGRQIGGIDIHPGYAGAFDLSCYYNIPWQSHGLSLGLSLTNLGTKISHTEITSDFLPANFALGAAWNINLNHEQQLSITTEINKLMVPLPQNRNVGQSSISAIWSSWSDATGGFREELQEFSYSLGAEYVLRRQLAFRMGYFKTPTFQDGQAYFSTGIGLSYRVFGIDLSYLFSAQSAASMEDPRDKTLQISLLCNLNNNNNKT